MLLMRLEIFTAVISPYTFTRFGIDGHNADAFAAVSALPLRKKCSAPFWSQNQTSSAPAAK
jgi:hypothetical protein